MVQVTKLQDIDIDKFKGGRTSLSEKIDLKYALNYFASNEFHFSEELLKHLEKGLCLFLEEKYEEAGQSFEIGQLVDSTEAAPYFFAALVYEYQKDFDSALELYSKALQKDKDIYDAYKKRGMIYEDKNNFKRAYVDYSHLIRLRPKSKFGYKLRGDLKLKFKDYIGASLELTEAHKRDSSDLEIVYNRGLAREQLQQFQSAIDDFSMVLNNNKRDSEAIFHLAYCNFQMGDIENASTLIDSSLRISKYNSLMHNLKGQIRTEQGRYHEAIYSYNKAISMASNQIDYLYNRAITYMKLKNWAGAITDLDNIIMKNPNIGLAFYQRALCYLEIEKKEQGIADLKTAEKLGYEPAKQELNNVTTL
jgi:tetratricopeptide (TPR) repeat protein